MTASQPLQDRNAVQEIWARAEALLAKSRAAGSASLADVEQLVADVNALAADSAYWYMRTDYFRESYRLAKGYTDDELNALLVMDEATKPHRRPCRFPFSPDCTCEEAAQ